jgi:flagellar biosynthesis protein FlhB
MAGGKDADSGNRTEKPTPKRLKDARRKGDVWKSRDVTATVVLIAWLVLGAAVAGSAKTRIGALCDALFAAITQGWGATGYAGALRSLGGQAAELALMLAAMLLVPAAALGMLTNFLQTGPVLSFDKVKPNFEHLSPTAGVQRMFSIDNLVDILKALAKTALLLIAGWLVVRGALPDIVGLARAGMPPQKVGTVFWTLTVKLGAWTVGLFALVSVLDAAYQRHSFIRKMRMSRRDIRQEMKESEGDPYIRQRRRQAHQEWSQRNQVQAARQANVLVVNPTHVAIAIDYDREVCPVPTLGAKGEDHVARAMREAAEEAGVPIVRNVPLARELLAVGEVGEVVPEELFDLLAEVILWARDVRRDVEARRQGRIAAEASRKRREPPGEDLTRYPEPPWNRSP